MSQNIKNIVMFASPIIEQTKVHFKILELLVITFGMRRYYNAMPYGLTAEDFRACIFTIFHAVVLLDSSN